ncbi:hypothetical protein FRC00_011489 [Tulasnella sp. 408]|nr:hypothetical protein FRC00_011489 [Tulasnella sp. 408]
MLGNIFRSRRSAATPSPQFQIDPTLSRPTPSKPPSKLLTKLKELKNVIRSGTSSKKGANGANHKSKKEGHISTRFDEVVDHRAPTPFTALDYEAPRTQSIRPYHYLGPNSSSTCDILETSAPSATVFLPPPSSFLNPSSAPHLPTKQPSPLCQQQAPTSQNGVDILVAKRYLAELEDIEKDPLRQMKLSKQPKPVVVRTAPFVQSYSAEIAWCQPPDSQLGPAANAPAEMKKTPKVEGSKWSKASLDLQEEKLYWAKRMMEYHQPHARHSSKPSQDSNMAVENEPISRPDRLSVPNQAPAADDDDTDDASSSSYDHTTQTSAVEPSFWLGLNKLEGGPTLF